METRREKEDYMNNIDQERYFDDHVNEKTIKENTKNIVINDILSNNEDEVVEPYYENPDIIDNSSIVIDTPLTVEEKLNGYKNIIDDKPDEIIVKKIDDTVENVVANDVVNDVVVNDVVEIDKNLNDAIIGGNDTNSNLNNETNIVSDDTKNIVAVEQINNIIKDDKDIKTVGLGKVEVVMDDKDETMTLDNFMNDVNDLLSDKKDDKSDFTLFNDAKEIES